MKDWLTSLSTLLLILALLICGHGWRSQSVRANRSEGLVAAMEQKVKITQAELKQAVAENQAKSREILALEIQNSGADAEALEPGQMAKHAGVNIGKDWVDKAKASLSQQEAMAVDLALAESQKELWAKDNDELYKKNSSLKKSRWIWGFAGLALGVGAGVALTK